MGGQDGNQVLRRLAIVQEGHGVQSRRVSIRMP